MLLGSLLWAACSSSSAHEKQNGDSSSRVRQQAKTFGLVAPNAGLRLTGDFPMNDERS
jgi:hypothetical protein